MSKFTASIFLIAAVFCCSALGHPLYDTDELLEKIALKSHRDQARGRKEHQMGYGAFGNDEATLRRHEKNNPYTIKDSSAIKHKRNSNTDNDEAVKMSAAADITLRAMIVSVLVDSVKESEREGLRQKLEDAAMNQHWNNIGDFTEYATKEAVKINSRSEGIKYNESDFDFSADSSNEA